MNNPFLTKKDPLIEAVQSAMQDGEIRRQAEAFVNEEFGVYSRKAVVREQLAAYDARLEEAYKCMKEGEKLAKKDYDKDGKIESPKDEVWGSRFRAAKMAGKMEEALKGNQHRIDANKNNKIDSQDFKLLRAKKKMDEEQIDEISRHTLMSYRNKAAKQVMDIEKKGRQTEKDRDTVEKRTMGHSLAGDKMRVRVAASYNKGYSPEDLAKHGGRGGAAPKKKMDEAQIDEAAYSAKAARAGKDIGKPGKMFSKIAKKAGQRYGSEERGKKVAGAILKRIRAKHMRREETQIDEIVTQAQLKSSGLSLRDYMNREKGLTRRDSSTPAAKTSTPQGAPGLKGPTGDTFSKTAMQSTQRWADPGKRDYSSSTSNQGTMKTPTPAPSTPAPEKTSWHAPMVRPPQELASKTADVNTGAPKVAQGAPMPSATAAAPKNKEAGAPPKTMAESVQVGENKYRIF